MQTLQVEDGKAIDYSQVDTSQLNQHIDKYTQIRFHAWDKTPKTATSDLEIQALYEMGTISLVSLPKRTEYYSKKGNVSLDGLKVTITFITQTPEYDSDGNRITNKTVTDNVALSCFASPSDLSKIFADGNSAEIYIYPQGSGIPLGSYEITYFPFLGDANLDKTVNSVDASAVLSHYASVSTGGGSKLTDEQFLYADVDRNGTVNAVDASRILNYYALNATGQDANWENILYGN